jgi:hypothetical protein
LWASAKRLWSTAIKTRPLRARAIERRFISAWAIKCRLGPVEFRSIRPVEARTIRPRTIEDRTACSGAACAWTGKAIGTGWATDAAILAARIEWRFHKSSAWRAPAIIGTNEGSACAWRPACACVTASAGGSKAFAPFAAEIRTRLGGQARFLRQQCSWFWTPRLYLAFSSEAQRIQFLGSEFAELARFNVEHQRTVADTPDLLDEMAGARKHLADFPIAAFDENDFVPRIFPDTNLANFSGRSAHARRARLALLDGDTFAQLVELFFT